MFCRRIIFLCISVWLLGALQQPVAAWAQGKPPGPSAANVSTSSVASGQVAPQAEFIGTVFFEEVSEVAAEISGVVEKVHFEEGQRVKSGQILVEVGSEILRKKRQSLVASYEQALSDLEIAKIDMRRKEKLLKKRSISEQSYDEVQFRVKGLEKRVIALKTEVERIDIELKKKNIRAPFSGVVINRHVDRGEWLSEGKTVAVFAKDDVVDIVAQIPERYIQYIRTGMEVKVEVSGHRFLGTIMAVVPRGDIATRTFPVKIRTPNTLALIEGMSAKVILPTGKKKQVLVIPRDALISKFGKTVVFVVDDSKARMVPVNVIGHEGLNAGVEASGLTKGMQVVVKGNERLRDGQPVALARKPYQPYTQEGP